MNRSKLSTEKQVKLIEHFAAGTTARAASDLVGVNKTTAAFYFLRLRKLICEYEEQQEEKLFNGKMGIDLACIATNKEERLQIDTNAKVPIFGLVKKNGQVTCIMIKDSKTSSLLPPTRHKIKPEAIVYYYGNWRNSSVLDIQDLRHCRANHTGEYVLGSMNIDSIDSFLSHVKRYLSRFNGIQRKHFYLFIKECQFRFNHPDADDRLEILRKLAEKKLL